MTSKCAHTASFTPTMLEMRLFLVYGRVAKAPVLQ